ncbi:MAG: flagellar export chaperone FliS [Lysobacterales bacterium CG17_big_fil_post_rev_8_21_14_2_50_64_11]|nr:MAG: flagellar export chaperone FliS [Xanthomonadales bacterium CG17_big_fil_post_rev_8_21_14_2_50_64_11]PIX60156.1 MAG: flagellar export chaperone FliS [Xanthomonadales bacterium CG_4_10_14_3_um_filter_64_11]
MSGYNALASYRSVAVMGDVEAASPHRLIELMMQGALDRIAQAQSALQRGVVASKGENVSKAINLIEGLRASLDHRHDAPIAGNLDALYDYMARRLLEANLRNDAAIFAEVAGLLGGIYEAWHAIPMPARDPGAASR